jgi:hypothetical protein
MQRLAPLTPLATQLLAQPKRLAMLPKARLTRRLATKTPQITHDVLAARFPMGPGGLSSFSALTSKVIPC